MPYIIRDYKKGNSTLESLYNTVYYNPDINTTQLHIGSISKHFILNF